MQRAFAARPLRCRIARTSTHRPVCSCGHRVFPPTVELVVSGCALPVMVMGLPRLRQLRPPPTDGRPGARQVHRSGFLSACGGRTAGESINGCSLEERSGRDSSGRLSSPESRLALFPIRRKHGLWRTASLFAGGGGAEPAYTSP